jgi:glycosyltransferase involved in cell wall biosynthesis
MPKVVHLIPYDGIGGVEAAARTMAVVDAPDLTFALRYIFPEVSSRAGRGATFNLARIGGTARALVAERPDLLVVSLWRSALVGILVKLLSPRTKLVLFVHNSLDAHAADRMATRAALRLSDAVWTDSDASVAQRFPRPPGKPVTTISYLSQRLEPLPAPAEGPPAPVFAFWGRLSPQKNVGRALALFARIHAARPDARFHVIGPDGGEAALLRAKVAELGLEDAVTFEDGMPFEAVRRRLAETGARFCLQTSRYEGMAMSVTEAMQLGLVPVVTPVGEIARYCRGGENAVLVGDSDEAAADQVLALLGDRQAWDALRARGLQAWAGRPLYRDSVLAAARALLGGRPASAGPSLETSMDPLT